MQRLSVRSLAFTGSMLAVAALTVATPLSAQTFNSTSDGSDGALVLNRPDPDPNPNQPFVIEFDPDGFDPPLDPDRDNVYHFTTITIGPDVTVRLSSKRIRGPVYWLAQGEVTIDGRVDLDGEPGHPSSPNDSPLPRLPASAGAGGFNGGVGVPRGTAIDAVSKGLGPGGGQVEASGTFGGGGGAGHAFPGEGYISGRFVCIDITRAGGGAVYGNEFLIPLLGGSGGGGGVGRGSIIGAGGGGGGGAILVASSATITLNGAVTARGGRGGEGDFQGGGGSGGAIRLAAVTLRGAGDVSASGGDVAGDFGCGVGGEGGRASGGRIRLEAFDQEFTGPTDPPATERSPVGVFLPEPEDRGPASLQVTSVGGTSLLNSTASITNADIATETRDPIEVAIEARNIPVGTIVNLRVISENAADQVLDSTPLAGTREVSTATVIIPALPSGFSRAFVRAEWAEE